MALLNSVYDLIYRTASTESLIILLLVLYGIYYFLHCQDLPPGPWGLPLLGYWPFLKSEGSHLQLQKLREKYGEIFSFTVTGTRCICLSSIKAIKEAHVSKSECFEERHSGYSILTLNFEGGVGIENGESWRVQRKFFTQKFREYGMLALKQYISGSLYDAVNETLEVLHATDGQPISITELLTVKCSHIIRRILFNDQGISEEELNELNHEYIPVLECQTNKNTLLMGNIARYLVFPFLPSFSSMLRCHGRIKAILNSVIQRHKSNFDESQAIDIIDSFYKEKEERQRKGDPTAKYFTDQALISSIYQFITDGVFTVAVFISFHLQYLVQHPEEQEKIYDELIEVIGPDRQPTIEDKSNLPYANAFIYEIIRNSDFFPMFPSLTCTRETKLNGYRIPKGAITVVNLWAAHHDPNVYEDPFAFNPSRFITTPGKQRPELPIIFGVGKRACMGESYVMIQAFLFLTTIVRNFRLTHPDVTQGDSNKILTEGEMKICAIPRNKEYQT